MREKRPLNRRSLVALAASAALLDGCDKIAGDSTVRRTLAEAEGVTRTAQRLATPRGALAREFHERDISPHFRANGTTNPDNDEYQELADGGFAEWRLEIGGLVERPATFSLAELRAMPARTQITRHDCVEGWSCIGKWSGPQLSRVLDGVGVQESARYAVFHCADALNAGDPDNKYYESIDLAEAMHPQTILAHSMNDAPLPIPHGAPLRLRVERQLGYKMAKYIMRIELVADYAHIAGGHGGYWEDLGYTWYAGI